MKATTVWNIMGKNRLMLKQNTFWFIAITYLGVTACSLQDPCKKNEYLDERTMICMEQTGKNCGILGDVNCNDPKVYDQTNIRSWLCENSTCQIAECMPNASPTDNKLACICNTLFYYDKKQKQCVKLNGEACENNGMVNCYVKYKSDLVSSWRCDTENKQEVPTCIVSDCILNAETGNSKKTCVCKDNYYFDETQKQCLNISGKACGKDGNIDCYGNNDPLISSWKCENSVCMVDSCKQNAHIMNNRCLCDSGYYFNEEYKTCMMLNAEHCGHNGQTNCNMQEGYSGLETWNCVAVAGESDTDWNYECKLNGCKINSHIVESGNQCECDKGLILKDNEPVCYKPSCIEYNNICHKNENCNLTTGECEVKSCEERCGTNCKNNECTVTVGAIEEPSLCNKFEFEVKYFISKHINEQINLVNSFNLNDDDVCQFYNQLYTIYNEEEAHDWCHNHFSCGSYKLIAFCTTETLEVLKDYLLYEVDNDFMKISNKLLSLHITYDSSNCETE